MVKFLKINVGERIWLVPHTLVSPEFMSAVSKFNATNNGEMVELTEAELKAFYEVNNHPATWKPF
jgi:hypothetical protein